MLRIQGLMAFPLLLEDGSRLLSILDVLFHTGFFLSQGSVYYIAWRERLRRLQTIARFLCFLHPLTNLPTAKSMTSFFYFDASGQKQGPVNDQQLRALAAQGVINPQTPLETDTGHKGQAGQIPGLFAAPAPVSPFAATPQPQPYASAQLVVDRPSAHYGRAVNYEVLVNGQKLGKVANGQNVKFSVPTGLLKLEIQSLGTRQIAPITMNLTSGQEKKVVLRLKNNYLMKSVLLSLLGIVPGIIYALTVPPYDVEEEV